MRLRFGTRAEVRLTGGSREIFRSVRNRDADRNHDSTITICKRLVSRRHRAHPLHSTVLQRDEQVAQIAADDLDFVV